MQRIMGTQRRTLISRLKSMMKIIHRLTVSPLSRSRKRYSSSSPPQESSDTSPPSNTHSTAPTASIAHAGNKEQLQTALCATEVYLPGHLWDALDPSERFATVADLCTHIGDQLPVQVVKLIARDVLRALREFHESQGLPYAEINPTNILLSPTDLRALISQLRADTQPSLVQSQLSIRLPFYQQSLPCEFSAEMLCPPLPSNPDTSRVFSLSRKSTRGGFSQSIPDVALVLIVYSEEGHTRAEYAGLVDQQALQAPEALLGAPCLASADMWSLGCVLFELLTGEALFDPIFQTAELGISKDESHLIQMIELFGEMPVDLIKSGTLSGQWFTNDGVLRIDTTYYPIQLASVLERHIEKSEVEGTTAFLERLLQLRPEDRARPRDIIDHSWFSS